MALGLSRIIEGPNKKPRIVLGIVHANVLQSVRAQIGSVRTTFTGVIRSARSTQNIFLINLRKNISNDTYVEGNTAFVGNITGINKGLDISIGTRLSDFTTGQITTSFNDSNAPGLIFSTNTNLSEYLIGHLSVTLAPLPEISTGISNHSNNIVKEINLKTAGNLIELSTNISKNLGKHAFLNLQAKVTRTLVNPTWDTNIWVTSFTLGAGSKISEATSWLANLKFGNYEGLVIELGIKRAGQKFSFPLYLTQSFDTIIFTTAILLPSLFYTLFYHLYLKPAHKAKKLRKKESEHQLQVKRRSDAAADAKILELSAQKKRNMNYLVMG